MCGALKCCGPVVCKLNICLYAPLSSLSGNSVDSAPAMQAFPYTKDQLVTGLLPPCLACHVSVAKLYNRQQSTHKVYTDFPLIKTHDNESRGQVK